MGEPEDEVDPTWTSAGGASRNELYPVIFADDGGAYDAIEGVLDEVGAPPLSAEETPEDPLATVLMRIRLLANERDVLRRNYELLRSDTP